jgi:hypothetical protein
VTIHVHLNAPIDRFDWIRRGVEEGIKRTGLSVGNIFVDDRSATVVDR